LLGTLFAAVRAEFERRHGVVEGARAGLLSFGKMASREMTATSDLDFIMLYDALGAEESNGERPLPASQYFARLTQRLVAAISAPTSEGVLYAADMRLRPSGNSGPLATSIPGFVSYHHDNAWTWEHLALSRARVIAADSSFASDIMEQVDEILSRPRDVNKTMDDVVAMRALMARERPPRHDFDLKLAQGGLVDIEFIAQSAQLVVRDRIALPQGTVPQILAQMGKVGLLPEADRLIEAHAMYSTVLQVMSAALVYPFKEEGWTPAFREVLAQLTNMPTFDRLTTELAAMGEDVAAAAEAWYARARSL